MPLRSIARLIQTMLYAQRFFPYYVYNILGGIEEDGKHVPFFSSSRTGTHLLLINAQVPARSTRLILWVHMSARPVVLLELHSLSCSPSSTIR